MKIKEWMTKKVVTATPAMSVRKAFGLMKANDFRHLPVVKQGKLVGIVTDRDLRRPEISDTFKEWDQLYRLSDEISVEDVMTTPVLTLTAENDIMIAASLLVRKKIGAVPIVDAKKKLVGILTASDLLRAFVKREAEKRRPHN